MTIDDLRDEQHARLVSMAILAGWVWRGHDVDPDEIEAEVRRIHSRYLVRCGLDRADEIAAAYRRELLDVISGGLA